MEKISEKSGKSYISIGYFYAAAANGGARVSSQSTFGWVGALGEGGMNHACLDGFHPLTSVLPGVGWMGIKVARGCEKLPRNRDGL
jgi:hypothetical protein